MQQLGTSTIAVSLMLACTMVSPSPAVALEDFEADCLQTADPVRRIEGCTTVLERHRGSVSAIAEALRNRGQAFRALGEYELALRDFETAERFRPGYALLYDRLGAMAALAERDTGQPASPLCDCMRGGLPTIN